MLEFNAPCTLKRENPGSNRDVLSMLLEARDEQGGRLSEDELIGHAGVIFAAGHETSSHALSPCVIHSGWSTPSYPTWNAVLERSGGCGVVLVVCGAVTIPAIELTSRAGVQRAVQPPHVARLLERGCRSRHSRVRGHIDRSVVVTRWLEALSQGPRDLHERRRRLDRRSYLIGKKVSAKDLREMKIDRDDFHGDWNYVIRPRARTVTG